MLGRRDADAGVGDREAQRLSLRPAAGVLDMQGHAALGRELHGVVEEIEQHLPHAVRVAQDPLRKRRIEPGADREAASRGATLDDRHRGVGEGGEVEGHRVEVELPGLDLGDVEDVVDDRQQGVAGGADQLQPAPVLTGEVRLVEEQARVADDAVERRADLVGHGGEEVGLGLARPLGLRARRLRLDGEGPQGLLAVLAAGDVEVQADHALRAPVAAVERAAEGGDPMPADAELGRVVGAGLDRLVDRVPGVLGVVGMDQGGPFRRGQLPRRAGLGQAVDAQALRREQHHALAHVPVPGPRHSGVESQPEEAFGLLEGDAGAHDLVDVERRAEPPGDRVGRGRIGDRRHHHLVPAPGAVVAAEAPLDRVGLVRRHRPVPRGLHGQGIVGMVAGEPRGAGRPDRSVVGLEAGVRVGHVAVGGAHGPDEQRKRVGQAAVAALAAGDLGLRAPPLGDVDERAEQGRDPPVRAGLAAAADRDVAHAAVGAADLRVVDEGRPGRDRGRDERADPLPMLRDIHLEHLGEVRRHVVRRIAEDVREARRPDGLTVVARDAPVAHAGELLGHGQELAGADLGLLVPGDLQSLLGDGRLVRPPGLDLPVPQARRPVEVEMGDDDEGEVAQRLPLALREGPGGAVGHAQRADAVSVGEDEGSARVEADVVGRARDRAVGEAGIGQGVRDDVDGVAPDGELADRAPARALPRQRLAGRLEPLPVRVDEGHVGVLDAEQAPGRAAHRIEMGLGRCIQDAEIVQRGQATGLDRIGRRTIGGQGIHGASLPARAARACGLPAVAAILVRPAQRTSGFGRTRYQARDGTPRRPSSAERLRRGRPRNRGGSPPRRGCGR
ncbi:hypothetical protein AOPFMNJM_3569 [Methylobacterium jeotgali]|uniref:Uncharacterized protein n=1 Tax=Methylobacterium jeotgali TaxID=381630 RepID=A0ABQ4T0G0_9HYPH|nr:hypothetical protein AOPFMNJM_3569 [Methylobacterium jeotgali]